MVFPVWTQFCSRTLGQSNTERLFAIWHAEFPFSKPWCLWLVTRHTNETAKSLPSWFQDSVVTQWFLIRPQLYLISMTLAWHTSSVFSREIAFFDETDSWWDKNSLLALHAFHPGVDCRKPREMGTHRDACTLFLSLQAWLRMLVRSQHTWQSCPTPFVRPWSLCHCPAPKSLLTLSHTRWCLQREPGAQMVFRLEDTEVYDTCWREEGQTDPTWHSQCSTFSRARQTIPFSNVFPLENKNQVSVAWVACLIFPFSS